METEVKSFKDSLQQAPLGPLPFSTAIAQAPTIPMKSFKAEVTPELSLGVALKKYEGN